MPVHGIGKHHGRSSLVAIVAVLVIGVVLSAMILSKNRGSAQQDDAVPADKSASAQPAKSTPNEVPIDDAQVKAAGITIESVAPARITSMLQFPGEVQLNDDRTVHVVPRVPGVAETVAVATGQMVHKGQLLVVFSSQQISEQRSALQSAERHLEHVKMVFQREKRLWEQRVSAEQDYLEAQHAVEEAEIRRDNAMQKLRALGVNMSAKALNRFELFAPYDGVIVERNLSIGEAVKEDTPIFTIADLSTVWVEVYIPAKDLPLMRVGDKVKVRATAFDAETVGTIAFIGALVGEQTRMAKARIVVANGKGLWRPGLFVNVEVKAGDALIPVTVKNDALQSIGTQQVIFVRDGKRFVPRPVTTGRTDGKYIEITSELATGTPYAAANSYVIKSELAKQASEDGN
ncbi:MAG: efflux RND transporter periplasmic adaptor subunit [Oxalobacteraceae bacterium]|nr:efflux RND transporter periplasmic adaptor subunit [Oxalobacteraceae bacterium]